MLLGGKSHGQIAPLAAGAEDVEDGVEDVPHVGLAGPAAAGLGREVGLDQGPLGVGDVARVMVHSHAITTLCHTPIVRLMGQSLNIVCTESKSCTVQDPCSCSASCCSAALDPTNTIARCLLAVQS